MKKQTMICNEVAQELREQMAIAIECGDEALYYEKEYGTAFISVDIYQRKVCGWWMTFQDVTVAHEDAHHQSPRLTEAISKALPSWDKMSEEYKRKEEQMHPYYQ
jgi:hypothetical protein